VAKFPNKIFFITINHIFYEKIQFLTKNFLEKMGLNLAPTSALKFVTILSTENIS
jgi:hypothetical protein